MINRLYIKNYAIIDELEIRFSEGLTIITGETGAGKSILLGALGLVMGKRADTKSLFDENEKCVVEGIFQVGRYQLQHFFQENELDYDPELIIRREISPGGKSRAFINDTPVNLKLLQSISSELIDLHQQFDTLDLNASSVQLKMLDALADNRSALDQYRNQYRQYQTQRRQLEQLQIRSQEAARETDFIQFQLKELTEAELQAAEQESLETELNVLNNAEDIKRTLSATFMQLSENEQAILGQLEEIGVGLHQIHTVNPELQAFYERFEGIIAELQDLSNEAETLGEQIEYDPQRIEEIQQRLDLIYRLQTKHGVASVDELLSIQQDLEAKLDNFSDLSLQISQLKKAIADLEATLIQQARHLSEKRKAVVPAFQEEIIKRLHLLAMPHAKLDIQFTALADLGPNGWDEVQFLFAANKGGRLQEIKDVASGGELSRLALVTKSLVASAIPLPTLIFDEIDTGISGDVALKMGSILRSLSNDHQVVSITHSPQIASRADTHYQVYKKVLEERTVTKVKLLDQNERIETIAVMLSQSPPSESAIENAKELLSIK